MRTFVCAMLAVCSVWLPSCGGGSGGGGNTAPVATDDAFDVAGNVPLSRNAAGGLVDPNDFDADGDALSVVAFDATTVAGGAVNVNADGSFTYEPPLGFGGADSFQYTIEDTTGLQSTATVDLTVTDVTWFIDATAGPGGDGGFTSPFDTLAAFNAVQGGGLDSEPETGDRIFVYEAGGVTYAGQVTLLDGQSLIGQGVSLLGGGTTIVPATSNSAIQAAAGSTVTLAMNNAIRGLDLGNTAGDGISGANVGTLSVDTTSVTADGGAALDVTDGTLAATLDTVRSDLGPASGLRLGNCGGSLQVSGTCEVFASGANAIDVQNSSCDVLLADVSIVDSDQHGVLLSGNNGTFTCNGGLIDNPDDLGILCVQLTGLLTIRDTTIRQAGDAAVNGQESHGLKCDDCTGDIRVENCTFDDMNETPTGAGNGLDNNGIQVENRDGGTLSSLQIIDCTFRGTVVGGQGITTDHGVKIVLDNGSDIADCDVTGSRCTGVGRAFCEVNCDVDDDGDACDIVDLNISGNGTLAIPIEAQAECVHLRVNGSSVCTFHIDNNSLNDSTNGHSSGNGIRVNSGEFSVGTVSTATVRGTINGNDVDNLGDGGVDNGIELQVQESTTAIVRIDNNTVDGQSDDGIRCRVFDNGTCDLTISNNSIGNSLPNTNDGIEVQTRSQITLLTLCLDIFNNSCAVGDPYVMNHDAGQFDLLNISSVVGGPGPWTATDVNAYLGSSGVNQNNVGTKATAPGTYTNCSSVQTP